MKKNLCGRALVRVRAKLDKTRFLVGVCLELWQKLRKHPFLVEIWLELGQK